MALELRFAFRLDKVVNVLAYFARAGVSDLTKLKAAKLLYLADRYHFIEFGRPISGDRYIAMDLGPVPENTYQLTTRLIDPDEVVDTAARDAQHVLQVYRGFLHRYRYPVLRARRQPDLSVFSDSEIGALERTVREFGKASARDLVNLTHQHEAYKRADAGRAAGSSVPLPYELFLSDVPTEQARMVRELAISEQEDRNFVDSLRAPAKAAHDQQRDPATTPG